MARPSNQDELDFARDAAAVVRDAPPRGATLFLSTCAALIASFITWAHLAELDEVTRGDGRVIPSSKTQIIQSLEGGIVKQLLVRRGDHVVKNQTILRIDDTQFSSSLGELKSKQLGLEAQITRLRSEADDIENGPPLFSAELRKRAPERLLKGLFAGDALLHLFDEVSVMVVVGADQEVGHARSNAVLPGGDVGIFGKVIPAQTSSPSDLRQACFLP